MAKKQRKKKKGFPVPALISVLIIGGIGYFTYTHPTQTKELVEKHAPTVKKLGSDSLSTSKALIEKTIDKAKELTSKEQTPTPSAGTPYSPDTKDLKICSFNIRIYSNKSRDDEELKYIAELLNECDITAIQELRDETVLIRTVKLLTQKGTQYEYQISGDVGRGVKERYAFLYNPKKVKPIHSAKLYNDTADVFIREPYYASFKSGNFDFTLITIHLLFGKNEKERRPELKYLAQAYTEIKKANPEEKDVIILGDFNFPPDDEGWSLLKNNPSMKFLIKPPLKTTITDTSLYDNFWFQSNYTKEYSGKSGINMFDETMFNNDDNKAKIAVSDHRPIWAIFKTTDKDDD